MISHFCHGKALIAIPTACSDALLCCTAHGELVKRMTSPIKVVHLQSFYNVPWSFFAEGKEFQSFMIYDMVKKTELHQDVDMFQKNSLKKTTLQRSKHLSPTHFYIYIHHFSTPFRSHWIMVGSYPDPQVIVSPQKATFEAIPFAPHRHQSTSDAAGVAQDTTARGASAERVFWWLKNHTK